jgi:hypothetical protein
MIPALPFMVGETIPGYCCGHFDLDTYDNDLRVEAVGVDWIVFRGDDGRIHFYSGDHQELRDNAAYQLRDRARAE